MLSRVKAPRFQGGASTMNEFKPQKIEKEVISIRITTDLLREIDDKSAAADISRNEFINQCIAFAIKSMKSEEK